MKKVISIALILLMFLVVACGCGGSETDNSSVTGSGNQNASQDEASSNTSGAISGDTSEDINDIIVNGVSIKEYQIVYPQYNFSPLVKKEIDAFVERVKTDFGYDIPVVKETAAPKDYEIILGNTGRSGNPHVEVLDNYEIKVDGNKIFINGGRNYSNAYAAKLVFDNLKRGKYTVDSSSGEYKESEDGYKLVWFDEFDTLDNDKWVARQIDHGSGYGNWYGMTTARSNSEENLWVEAGNLYMNATYDEDTFYGTWLDTNRRMEFTYGFIEISQRPADGNGIWTCLWTWNDNKQGHLEFDIVEVWGPASYYVSVIHELIYTENGEDDTAPIFQYITKHDSFDYNGFWANENKEIWTHQNQANSLWNEYHTFSCEWTEDDVTMYRDGEVTAYHWYTDPELLFDRSYLYRQKYYLILSMLNGANYGGMGDSRRPRLDGDYWSNGRSSSIIEYVQLFQKEGQFIEIYEN